MRITATKIDAFALPREVKVIWQAIWMPNSTMQAI